MTEIQAFIYNGFDMSLKERNYGGDYKGYSISFKKHGEWVRNGVSVSKYKKVDGLWVKGRDKSEMVAEAKRRLLEWVDTL